MKFLFYGPAIFISFLFLFFLFDHKGTCLENGGVWDEKAKRCRYDCLLWTHKRVVSGCMMLFWPHWTGADMMQNAMIMFWKRCFRDFA